MDEQDPGLQLVHLLRAVTVDLDLVAAEFAARHRLHATDLRALIALLDAARTGEPVTPGRLGARLRLTSASTTALLDRLERSGLVRRERDAHDRRRVHVTVTDEAVALGWSFFGPLITDVVTALQPFDEAELAVARRFLCAVRDAVDGRRSAQ